MRKIVFYILCFPTLLLCQDINVNIPEIILEENLLNLHLIGAQNWYVDTSLSQNTFSISEILSRFGNVTIKEYGSLSTAFFRGLPSSNTQILWNKTPLNSLSTGIVDLGLLIPSSFSSILINSGGHSNFTGSGAVGGSIQLKNQMIKSSKFNWDINYSIGDFGMKKKSFKYHIKDSINYFDVIFIDQKINNDFYYVNNGLPNELIEKQENAYKSSKQLLINSINNSNYIKSGFNLWISKNFRKVPVGMLSFDPKAIQFDNSFRSNFFYNYHKNNFKIDLSYSYLKEDFEYESLNVFSKLKTYQHYSLIDFCKKINNVNIYSGINFQNRKVNSNYYLKTAEESLLAYYFSIKHNLNKITYNISIRKEIHHIYKIPNIFSFNLKYNLARDLTFKGYISNNFRSPSFNDLYWVGDGALGNINLNPEISFNSEASLNYKNVHFIFYSNLINQMIYWQPNSIGIWEPQNLKEVMSRGLEIKLNNKFKLKNFEIISQSTFCNTVSQIQKSNINNDNSIGKQLSYVPKLKVSNLIHLKSKNWMTSLLTSYNGKVYTTSDETRSLPRYFLLDILFHYTFYDPLNITFKINNLTNKSYQVYEWYPMPGRNYSINFNYKF